MEKILAIGGAVVKTARSELMQLIKANEIEMLIHNGGSLFHDFQHAIDPPPKGMHSYTLSHLMRNREELKITNKAINLFFTTTTNPAPVGSVTHLCREKNIPVLVFTALGCDWWQHDMRDWASFSAYAQESFNRLVKRFVTSQFHYVCMGSAVIHPEVFIKALAFSYASEVSNWFKADVVDFLDMYRPRTRVSIFGNYFTCEHHRFIQSWLKYGYPGKEEMVKNEETLSADIG